MFLPSVCLFPAGLFCYFGFSLCVVVLLRRLSTNYWWILKLLRSKYKLTNLRGNHLISTLAAFVFVPSVLGENIPTSEIWNDIGRNCLLGHRKKIAKF
jgi:hypothetical protein